MTVKIDGVEPNIFPDVDDLDARDAGRNVEVFLDVRVDAKLTPVTVKLSYEQASDWPLFWSLSESPRPRPRASEPGSVFLPFFEFARQLLNTRLNVTAHQAPIFASTFCSLLVDRLADPFKRGSQSLDFVPNIIVDRLLG